MIRVKKIEKNQRRDTEDVWNLPKSEYKWLVIGVIVAILFFAFQGMQKSAASKATAHHQQQVQQVQQQAALATPEIELPKDQLAFFIVADFYCKEYDKAINELKKTALRIKRRDEFRELPAPSEFKDWIVRLDRMGTTKDGQATVSFAGIETCVTLTNSSLMSLFEDALIPFDSALYNALADMDSGDLAYVSGKLLRGERDYVLEGSLSESGSMTDPEFVARFTDIRKLEQTASH